jgi:hypothetical protein
MIVHNATMSAEPPRWEVLKFEGFGVAHGGRASPRAARAESPAANGARTFLSVLAFDGLENPCSVRAESPPMGRACLSETAWVGTALRAVRGGFGETALPRAESPPQGRTGVFCIQNRLCKRIVSPAVGFLRHRRFFVPNTGRKTYICYHRPFRAGNALMHSLDL